MGSNNQSSSLPRVALVVGANRGIGLALVRRLAARGRRVIAACRHSSPELDAERARGVQVETDLDVTVAASVDALARRLGETSIDELVCSAGILRHDELNELAMDEVRAQFEVNAIGPLRVVQALRARLGRGSKIALITSRMGSIGDNGSGGSYGYRMSKAALNAAGVSLARDLAGAGVAVAVLHPGYVRTQMTGGHGNVDAETAAAQLVDRIDALTLASTGTFWHANGEVLPW
ncbi:MAG TPA: SDR family oxidoreductase [Polyangia bacterium]|nr:SDR family oxidoreductase [Polyangia bacterium]